MLNRWKMLLVFGCTLSVVPATFGQPQEGACCLPDGSCLERTKEICAEMGGRFFPDRSCEDVNCRGGACCLRGGSCREMTEEECRDFKGQFSPGQSCEEVGCEIPCDDVKKLKANCKRSNGKLKVIVKMADRTHDGEVVTLRLGEVWKYIPIRGKKVKLKEKGWVGDFDVELFTPNGCLVPVPVVCEDAEDWKWCRMKLTSGPVVSWSNTCVETECPVRKTGDKLCPHKAGQRCTPGSDCDKSIAQSVLIRCTGVNGGYCKYEAEGAGEGECVCKIQ